MFAAFGERYSVQKSFKIYSSIYKTISVHINKRGRDAHYVWQVSDSIDRVPIELRENRARFKDGVAIMNSLRKAKRH